MRRRTPFALLAAIAAMLMVLAACGGAEDTAPEPAPAPDAPDAPEPDEGEEEAEAVDFPTREIRFINRGSPGGGHDTFARAVAPLLEEQLGVNVIVENMTGGAGVVAAEYMREVEPDGHTVHLMDPVGLIGNAVAEDENFDFDTDFDWHFLGTVTQRSSVFAVGVDSPYNTWDAFVEGMQDGGLRWSHTGLGSTHAYNAMIVLDALGLPMPTFIPHESSPDVFTALARGDGDFTVLAIDSVYDAIQNGDVEAILHFSGTPMDHLLPDVPRGQDIGLDEFDGVLVSSLAVVAPPDTPEEIVEILRDAFETVFFSEELAQWGEDDDRVVDPLTAADTEAQLRNVTSFYQDFRDIIVAMLEE